MVCNVTRDSYGYVTGVNGSEIVTDDPDVAGIGVIIGFTLSAYITMILVIIHYLFNYRHTQNPIDRASIKFLTPKSWNDPQGRPSKKWTQALESAVLMYSDTQILTGIAILLCAYLELGRGISIYHWRVTVQLAWFSSVTHLTTLTSLRTHFQERPKMALWRTFLMGVTLLLLIIALVPTGFITGGSTGSITSYLFNLEATAPAICLFSNESLFGPFYSAVVILSIIILLTSYVTRVIKLFTPLSGLAHRWLRIAPGNLVKSCFDQSKTRRMNSSGSVERIFWTALQYCSILVYVLFKATYEIGESMLWEIIWLVIALAWGTLRLVYSRANNGRSAEDLWGFGQIMVVMLSLLPLWSIYACIQEITHNEANGALPVHHSSVPTNRPLNSPRPFPHLDLYQTAWFPKLIILMFAMALIFAAGVLGLFPLAVEDDPGDAPIYIPIFLIPLSLSALALVVFVSICLAIQFNRSRLPPWLDGWKQSFEKLDKKKQSIIQRILWTMTILLLLGIIAGISFAFIMVGLT